MEIPTGTGYETKIVFSEKSVKETRFRGTHYKDEVVSPLLQLVDLTYDAEMTATASFIFTPEELNKGIAGGIANVLKIRCIKMYRAITQRGLKESKDNIESYSDAGVTIELRFREDYLKRFPYLSSPMSG